MESILDKATQILDEIDRLTVELESIQPEIRELEKYYTSTKWRKDLELDARGGLPADLKRGVLSEDGIYNLLERISEFIRAVESRD